MYPVPPESRHPTNYYGILIACVLIMLLVVFGLLRSLSSRVNANAQVASGAQTAASPKPGVTPLSALTPTVAANSATPEATPTVTDVDIKDLAVAPATYRSRPIKVRGRVFYTGKTDDGRVWIQIVGPNNIYVDSAYAGTLPVGVRKDSEVEITGIGAGLTTIRASNGKDYDQPYIDPVQKVELVGS